MGRWGLLDWWGWSETATPVKGGQCLPRHQTPSSVLAQLRLTPEKDMCWHVAHSQLKNLETTPVPRVGEQAQVGLGRTTTTLHARGGAKERAVAACDNTDALCNAE